jgi:hypothetical protein
MRTSLRHLFLASSFAVISACNCGGGNTCNTNADCMSGQVCSAGMCVTPDSGTAGGAAGGAAGGMAGGAAGGMAGGAAGGMAGGAAGGMAGGAAGGMAGGAAGGDAGGMAGGAAGGEAGGSAGGAAGGSAGGAAGGSAGGAAGGSAGGAAGGSAGGAAGGSAGGAAGGSAGGAAGGSAGGAAGGSAGGAAGGSAGGAAGGSAGGAAGGSAGGAAGGSADSGTILAGDQCNNAELATTAMAIAATTVGYTNNYTPPISCTGFLNDGPDRVFSFTIPPGQRLVASATPTGASGFDPSIYILPGNPAQCSSSPTCLAGDDTGAASAPATARFDNTTVTPLDVFIVVDSFFPATSPSSAGDFTLSVSAGPIPSGTDVCDPAAPAISANTTLTGETLFGFTNNYTWSLGSSVNCIGSGAVNQDKAYTVVVSPDTRLTVTANRTGGASWTPSLQLVTACPAGDTNTCLAAVDATAMPSLTYSNRSGVTQTLFLVVDTSSSLTAADTYSIDFAFASIPPLLAGDICATAPAAMASEVGTTIGFENNYSSGTGCALGSGRDRVYSLSVPPGQQVVSTITSTLPDGGTGANPTLSLIAGGDAGVCDSVRCVASANLESTNTESVVFFNPGSSAQPLLVVVDTTSTTDPGQDFTLTSTFSTPAQGEVCENPLPLVAGTPRTGQNLTTAQGHYSGTGTSCSSLSTRSDLVYSVTVPAGNVLTVTVTPDAALNTSISLARTAPDCASRVCISNGSSGGTGLVESLTYLNRSTQSETILVIVDSSTAVGGTFDILATVAAAPAGASCALAEVYVPDGGTETGLTTNGFGGEYAQTTGGCQLLNGNDRVWSVTIPPGQRGIFRAIPDGGADVSLSAVLAPAANCEATPISCIGGEDRFFSTSTGDRTEVLTRFNSSTTPEQLFVIVDQFNSSSAGFFDFSARLDTPPLGDRCDSPIVLMPSTPVNADFASFVNDYAGSGTSCSSGSNRQDAVFRVTVPSNSNLDVTVTPGAGLDTTISVALDVAACNSRTCLANFTGGGAGSPDVIRISNTGLTPTDFLLIVDHTTVAAVTTFTIATAEVPLAQGETCSVAVPLPPLPADGLSLGGFANNYGGGGNCAPGTFSQADRVFNVSIPPGRTTFTLTPDGGMGLSASLVDAPATTCDTFPRACVSGADSTTTTGPAGFERLSVSNTGTTNRDMFLIVDTATSSAGLFSLSRVDSQPLVPGEDCDTAIDLGDGGTSLVGETTFGMEGDLAGTVGTACTGNIGRDRVYRVSVPPGQRLITVVQPDAGFDPVVDLIPGELGACYRRECGASSSTSATGVAEVVAWTNGTTASQNVFISVDSTSFTGAAGTGNFDLSTSFAPALPGDVCSTAIPVGNGTALSTSIGRFSREYPVPTGGLNGCQLSTGPDLVYSATVPAGQRLTAVTSNLVGDISLNLVQGPATNCRFAPTCLASGGTAPEQLSWLNTGTTAAQVFLIISRASGASTVVPSFSLAVTIN